MREYLFRAWDKTLNRMIFSPRFSMWYVASCCDYILMQFTGLHDKNKKRIFENDVVKHKNYNHLMKVVWVESHCCFKLISKDGRESDLTNTISNMLEVVGTTYDNPNLLKEVK